MGSHPSVTLLLPATHTDGQESVPPRRRGSRLTPNAMNDAEIERLLRELPAAWRAEILAVARREARVQKPVAREWPPILLWLGQRLARNPISASAFAALWLLIFLFHATTPVDPQEQQILAHLDTTKPVYLLTMADEIRLVEIAEQTPARPRPIP